MAARAEIASPSPASAASPALPLRSGVRLRALVLIRWAAVAGQIFTAAIVHWGLGFTLPVLAVGGAEPPPLLVVGCTALGKPGGAFIGVDGLDVPVDWLPDPPANNARSVSATVQPSMPAIEISSRNKSGRQCCASARQPGPSGALKRMKPSGASTSRKRSRWVGSSSVIKIVLRGP